MRTHRVLYGNGDFFALHLNFAASNEFVVSKYPAQIVLVSIKFNYGTTAHFEQLMNGHNRFAYHDGQLYLYCIDCAAHASVPYSD